MADRLRRCATGTSCDIDVEKRAVSVALSDAQISNRLANWHEPPLHYPTGVMAKYAAAYRRRRRVP